MAQTVEEIAEILNAMKLENEHNALGFEKILTALNNKLDMMADDNETADLMRIYLNELKNSVEDKHKYTASMFSSIEQSFNNILSNQEMSAKSSDINNLFNSLSENVNSFYAQVSSQKDLIEHINDKLEIINTDKSDKNDIISNISSIKADFEDLNLNIEKSFSAINASLKSAVQEILSLDLTAQNEVVKKELENITITSNAILSAMEIFNGRSENLSSLVSAIPSQIKFDDINSKIDDYASVLNELKYEVSSITSNSNTFVAEQFEKLEKELSTIVTDSDFAGFRNDLADFVQKIIDNSSVLNSELSYSTERIEHILATVKSLDFREDFENVVSKIFEVKSAFENASTDNYTNLSGEISVLTDKLNESFEKLDSARKEAFQTLKSEIDSVIENTKNITELVNNIEFNPIDVLEAIDKTYDSIESIISDAKDNSDTNYNAIKEYFDELTLKVNSLSEEFKQIAGSDIENSSRILSSIDVVSDKIEDLKTSVQEIANADASGDILINIEDVSSKIDNLNDSVTQLHIEDIEELKAVAEQVKNVQDSLSFVCTEYKNIVEDKVNAVKELISATGNSLYDTQTSGNNLINEKLALIGESAKGFEASLIDVNLNLQNIIKNILTMDVTEQNDIIKRELENIYLASNAIISSLKISDQKNEELAKMIANLVDKENYEDSQNKLNEIISKAQDIANSIAALPSNNDINNINAKLEEFSGVLTSVKDVVSNATEGNSNIIAEQFEKFETAFAKVITEEDFAQFRAEFTEFIQKIIDNSTVLNFNSQDNKIKIGEIFEKLDTLNYTERFQNIASGIDDIRDCFENNSKMNYENLSNEIIMLSERFQKCFENLDDDRKQNFSTLKDDIDCVIKSVKELNETAPQKSLEILNNISQNVSETISQLENNFNAEISGNFENIKSSIDGMIADLNEVKEDFVQKSDAHTFNITAGFDTFKVSIDELITSFDSLKTEIVQTGSNNIDKISDVFHDIYEKTVLLINSMEDKSCADASLIKENIDEISNKIDHIQDNIILEINNNLSGFKDVFTEDVKMFEQTLNEKSEDYKSHVSEVIESLRNYIAELNTASKSVRSLNDTKVAEKLLSIEALITHGTNDYDEKLNILQTKIADYIHTVESASSDTDTKLDTSLTEITDIKSELQALSQAVKENCENGNEKIADVASLFDSGIQNIIDYLTDINSSVKSGFDLSVKDDLETIDGKFDNLLSLFDVFRNSSDELKSNLLDTLEEKLGSLKQELNLINTDIVDAFNSKSEEIIRGFEPIKIDIDTFLNNDFSKLLEDIKSQLEVSYMNMTTDISNGFLENQKSLEKLEQAYKETVTKIASIEECLHDQTQNNIELLKLAVENVRKNLDLSIDKNNAFISDWKDEISQIKEKLISAGEDYNNSLAMLGDDLKNVIDDKLNTYIEDLKSHIRITLSPDDTMLAIDKLKEDISSKINGALIEQTNISDKVSIVDKYLKESFSDVINKINSFEIKDYTEAFDALNEKIDVIAADTSILDINDKIDDLAMTENKITETLMALHQKVDTLALFNDTEEFDVEGEIEDIKSLIIEQRKFFENSEAGTKTNALSSGLDELLGKLQNIENSLGDVDIAKSNQDIKESIMAAIVSVFEQVSFVEETEEIKDFVEEKTDEINKHLQEVREQLKQIANGGGEGLDYSYTLQDVESDIAKLRLALSDISNSTSKDDINDLSENINKIASSVEGLKSSLTPDQMFDLKEDIEKLNEDIISISSRTNKLLLTSDESYKALNSGLDKFSNVVSELEERISYLDNSEISERIEKKIDTIKSMAVSSGNTDKVFHQVLMYMGEWIDSASEDMASITEKVSEINEVKNMISELKDSMPEKTSLLEELEAKFENQESRIDRLEMKIEKILSTLEEKDDMMLNNKVDKIEKQLSRLSINIEKLASYVDEE